MLDTPKAYPCDFVNPPAMPSPNTKGLPINGYVNCRRITKCVLRKPADIFHSKSRRRGCRIRLCAKKKQTPRQVNNQYNSPTLFQLNWKKDGKNQMKQYWWKVVQSNKQIISDKKQEYYQDCKWQGH